jgi:hypothetical protein
MLYEHRRPDIDLDTEKSTMAQYRSLKPVTSYIDDCSVVDMAFSACQLFVSGTLVHIPSEHPLSLHGWPARSGVA